MSHCDADASENMNRSVSTGWVGTVSVVADCARAGATIRSAHAVNAAINSALSRDRVTLRLPLHCHARWRKHVGQSSRYPMRFKLRRGANRFVVAADAFHEQPYQDCLHPRRIENSFAGRCCSSQ